MQSGENDRTNGSRPRFVGRDRELERLRTGLEATLSGHGQLFLISGEPGIGKTRLAEQFSLEAVARGATVLWGRCWEGSGAPAYWPIIQILRACAERPDFSQSLARLGDGTAYIASLVPDFVRGTPAREPDFERDPGAAEQARFRLFDAVARLLRSLAAHEPMVVVIDDVHDANPAVLEMLRFLARELKDVPLLLIGTHREAEIRRSPELRTHLANLGREGSHLPILGLTLSDSAELVRALSNRHPGDQFVATLHQVTAGNPLFLSGVVQMLAAEDKLESESMPSPAELKLPTNVRGAIRSRLNLLSQNSMALLSIAAALGIGFDAVPLKCAAGAETHEVFQALDEASNLGIIAPVSGFSTAFRFTHALVRSEIYVGMGNAERARLHFQIGEALEDLYGANAPGHLAQIASHFRLALPVGPVEKAIDYSIRASEAAETVCAYEEVVTHGEAALALIEQRGGSRKKRADLLSRVGTYLHYATKKRGLELLESAATAYEELNLPHEAASIRQRLGFFYVVVTQFHDIRRGLVHLRKAEDVLSRGPPTPALARVYNGLAEALKTNSIREALTYFARAMAVAEQTGDTDVWCVATARFAVLETVSAGPTQKAKALLEEVWERLPTTQVPYWCVVAVLAGALAHGLLWDHRGVRDWLEKGLARPLITDFQRDLLRCEAAECCLNLGDLAAMREHLGDWQHFHRIMRGRAEACLARAQGDRSRQKLLKESTRLDSLGMYIPHLLNQWSLATKLRDDGQIARADEIVSSILKPCEEDEPLLHREMLFRPNHALNLTMLGDLDRAQRELLRCAEILGSGEDWRGLAGHYHQVSGFCAAAGGNYAESDHHYDAAIQIFRRWPNPWGEAITFREWGQVLANRHEYGGAREKFEAAIDIYRQMGAATSYVNRTLIQMNQATEGAEPTAASLGKNACLFRREGEYWTIAYDNRTARLRDSRGFNYIVHLISHPGERFHVSELARMVRSASPHSDKTLPSVDARLDEAGISRESYDAGEVIDRRAAAEYRRRIEELRAEIDEAERLNDLGRAEKARAELEAISAEIRKVEGLGGRPRTFRSVAERERIRINKAISASIQKIRGVNPGLARHLSNSIRTGYTCSYQPAGAVHWIV